MKTSMTKQQLFQTLGTMLGVSNLESTRTGGGKVKNQFLIRYQNGEVLQSYNKLIGVRVFGNCYFIDPTYHDYSATTAKYCTQWCGQTTAERRRLCDPNNTDSGKHWDYLELN